jgi:hypothetical protein
MAPFGGLFININLCKKRKKKEEVCPVVIAF